VLAEPLHTTEDIQAPTAVCNGLSGSQGKSTHKHRQPREERLLVGIEQVVAPGNGVPLGALERRKVAGATGEHRQSLTESRQECLWGQHANSCCRELDGQWQPIEAPANLGDGRSIVIVDGEAGTHGLGARDEQPNGFVLGELLRRGRRLAPRKTQRRNRVFVFRLET
jgi:hypothetical protein